MLHNPALEASYVTTYVEDFLDGLESLPNLIQPHVSEIKRLDVEHSAILGRLEEKRLKLCALTDSTAREQCLSDIAQLLFEGQVNGDEKLAALASISDLIERKTEQLEHDANSFGASNETRPATTSEYPNRPARSLKPTRTPFRAFSPASTTSTTTTTREVSLSVTAAARITKQSATAMAQKQLKRARRAKQFPDFVGNRKEKNNGTREATPNKPSPAHSNPSSVYEFDDNDTRDSPLPDKPAKSRSATPRAGTTASKSRRGGASSSTNTTATKKRRAASSVTPSGSGGKRAAQNNNADDAETEQLYCVCSQASWGEMIGCDNNSCEIEWFHFSCVAITSKPKGKWYCPNCRGDKCNVLKPGLSGK